jgi:hypothetical protein
MSSSPQASADDIRRDVIRAECELDHLFFTRYFFKQRQSIKFIVNWHHHLIADALQRVLDGTCQNLVINVPPDSSKTEMAVINFIARGLALNPNARFLHITSGDDLALLNSQTARDIVQSDEYQDLWPLQIADDAKAKKRWNVIVNGKKAGGVYAVSLGGQITGFRAGHMAPGFQGAIIILDDLLKADEAYSPAAIKAANRRLLSTVKSRKANPATPVILIMQRVGENDPLSALVVCQTRFTLGHAKRVFDRRTTERHRQYTRQRFLGRVGREVLHLGRRFVDRRDQRPLAPARRH